MRFTQQIDYTVIILTRPVGFLRNVPSVEKLVKCWENANLFPPEVKPYRSSGTSEALV